MESFSFVKGLWLLDLNNRQTFLVDILGSPLHLVFLDGDWKVFCFLTSGKLLWDLYLFRESLSCLQEGDFSLGVFAGGPQLAWIDFVFIRGFSLVSLRSMIFSCYFSVAFSFFLMYQQIWYGWHLLCRREGALTPWGKTLDIELAQSFSNWSG